MLESALGVDTCTRVQTVWQVRASEVKKGTTCKTKIASFPPPPSAGRLTSRANKPPAPSDPCAVAPVGGYRGLENRLYRVEIHDGGDLTTATFKWSRDNGAVASPVIAVDNAASPQVITVQRLGRDQVLRFHQNEWVELLDDTHELDGKPGLMGQVLKTDPSDNTITLSKPLGGAIDPARNPRLRRWDQQAGVNAGGVIPVSPAPASGFVALEDGVEIKLELADPAGSFHTGDWWVFDARSGTASIEELNAEPPRGIRHHYAKLAVIQGGKVLDCRVIFPGECECDGTGGCECTACVTPESHASGALTIQDAIDKVTPTGGRVCIEPGRYRLREPLRIERARGLTLAGAGSATVITYEGEARYAILVQDSVEVSLERFALAAAGPEGPRGLIGIALANTAACRVERCLVLVGIVPGSDVKAHFGEADIGVGLTGFAMRTRLRENVIAATTSIGDIANADYLASLDLGIDDNLLLGLRAGVAFADAQQSSKSKGTSVVHVGLTRIAENLILGGQTAGIVLAGLSAHQSSATGNVPVSFKAPSSAGMGTTGVAVLALAALELGIGEIAVKGNSLVVSGDGIRAIPDALRIADNEIAGARLRESGQTFGVALFAERAAPGGHAAVTGNLVRGFGVGGVVSKGSVGSVTVSTNRIMDVGVYGVVTAGFALSADVTIAENTITGVALGTDQSNAVRAVWVTLAGDVRIAGNVIRQVGSSGWNGSFLYGIDVQACKTADVSANVLTEIGPDEEHGGWVIGIGALRYLTSLDVRGNTISLGAGGDISQHTPVLIGQPPTQLVSEFMMPIVAKYFGTGWFGKLIGVDPVPEGQPDLSVHGNALSAGGREAIVLIDVDTNVLLAENRCRRQGRQEVRAVVAVQATGATIVSSNRVEGARQADASVAVDLNVDPVAKGTPHCTVLGNIADGGIDLNGAALAAPWAPLNINA
jgi:hypothetical protein